jgi:hypothetical protein
MARNFIPTPTLPPAEEELERSLVTSGVFRAPRTKPVG